MKRIPLLMTPTPLQINAMDFWFRSTDGVTLVSSAVSQWNDLSGNGLNATQGTSGNRPTIASADLNGKDTLIFTSANTNYLDFGSTTNFFTAGTAASFYIVMEETAALGSVGAVAMEVFATGSGGTVFSMGVSTTANGNFRFGFFGDGVSAALKCTGADPTTTYKAYVVVYNGGTATSAGSYTVNQNGISLSIGTSSVSTRTPAQNRIGATTASSPASPFPGKIAEIGKFPVALSGPQQAQLSNYLTNYWGLA